MSEQVNVAQTGQTNETTVPKSELDRIQASNTELTKNLETLKNQLLDTEYLQYLEAKKGRTTSSNATSTNIPNVNSNIGSLTLAQLQQVVAQQIGQAMETTMKPVYGRINEMSAKLEVEDVRSRYSDFDDFKDQVVSILESTPNTELSIEQAYKIAKADKLGEPAAAPAQEEKKPTGNEKPGGTVPLAGESAQRHKDSNAAGQAAWNEVRGKYGLAGDTI